MARNTTRKCIDAAMFFALCFLVGTGLLITYRLAPGSRGFTNGSTLLRLDSDAWRRVHLWNGYAVIALLLVHLVLNFSFIKNVLASRSLPLLLCLALAGSAVILAFLLVPVEPVPVSVGSDAGAAPAADSDSSCPFSAMFGGTGGPSADAGTGALPKGHPQWPSKSGDGADAP